MSASRVLAVNLGSATLKAAAFDLLHAHEPRREPELIERARCEVHAVEGNAPFDRVAEALTGHESPPDFVIHRIVHGGDRVRGAELDEALFAELEALAPLAPLHQPQALALARAARLQWPRARHAAGFDTSFHADLPAWSRRLPIPPDWAARGLRRYGFHGLAFASALRQVAMHAPSIGGARVVMAHLGGGCSVCAVHGGRSVDTTMALTPLSGIPGPTRAGDLDPGLVLRLVRDLCLDPTEVEQRLARESGLAALAGYGDLRELLVDARPEAMVAVEQFVVRVAQAIAAMAIAAGGLEHLVFSGGSGHGAPVLRARIVERLAWMGLALDDDRNGSGACLISPPAAPPIWNIAVDEERELAIDVLPALLSVHAGTPGSLPALQR